MELMPTSRSFLSSCNRLVAPSRTASASTKRTGERGIVLLLFKLVSKWGPLMCKHSSVFGSERACRNVERIDEVDGKIRRRAALTFLLASPALSVAFSANGKTKSMNPYDERRLLEQNKKIQAANRAPDDFPNFIREGFEEGIRDMKPGGKRRIIIPPELGPPVGPSTFFSAKQFEVFDVELLAVQDCQRRTIAFYSDVVCS
ncbi:hypothetical protein EJB05_12483 [Eragrostis curvula]|uniref:Rotamase n=1 Tax=Eragrostis curvula TaxID=38414 RepID=A0A5J9VVH8_9POAL|nr:hypothetical protein EJB05_12483 [Eragrostis curvula]